MAESDLQNKGQELSKMIVDLLVSNHLELPISNETIKNLEGLLDRVLPGFDVNITVVNDFSPEHHGGTIEPEDDWEDDFMDAEDIPVKILRLSMVDGKLDIVIGAKDDGQSKCADSDPG